MNYTDLKIGQKVFFVSAENRVPVEEVFITKINKDNTFFIERNGKTILFEITKEIGVFNFSHSDDEKDLENYGFLYLSLELIEQDEKFYRIISDNVNEIENLSVEDKIKLVNFLESLLKKENK